MALTQEQKNELFSWLARQLIEMKAEPTDFASVGMSIFLTPLLRRGLSPQEVYEVSLQMARLFQESMGPASAITRSQLRQLQTIGGVQ